MYTEFYQMTERPFNVTPDPKFLYLNARYREAIASLNYGISQRKGFITLIGEAGTGKTTLLKRLLEDLDPKTKTVFIFNTNVSFEEILEYIFAEFDLAVHNGKKLYMLQRLNTFLLEELRNGGNVALLIDEAQDLEFSVLEDLRLLSNLETAKEKILQIVLSGQPELGQKLSNPILRQLRQRISINCRLLPLSREEIAEYLQFRLQAAGCPDLKLFSRDAEERVYHFSRGVPRLVNVVCDNALVIGYALGKKRIGADLIDEAAADLLPVEILEADSAETITVTSSAPSAPRRSSTPWQPRAAIGALVLLALAIGGISITRSSGPVPAAAPTEQVRASNPGALDFVPPAAPHGATEAERGGAMGVIPVEVPPTLAIRDPREDFIQPDEELAAARRREALEAARRELALEAELASVGQQADEIEEPEPVNAAPAVAPAEAPRVAAVEVAVPAPAREPVPEPVRAPVAVAPAPAAPRPAAVPVAPPPPRPEPVAPRGTLRLDGVPFARITVQTGDSISGIAQRKYGQATPTILDLLMLANPQLRDIDVVSAGETIRLPQLSDGFPVLHDGSGSYSLLVYSTGEAWRANSLRTALRGHGYDAVVAQGSLGRRRSVYRVVVSGFRNRDEVATVGRSMQSLFRDNAQLAQLTR